MRKKAIAMAALSLLIFLTPNVVGEEFDSANTMLKNVYSDKSFAVIADASQPNVIKPIRLDFKFHEEPVICLFGTDEKVTNEGLNSISDWQNKLRSYTNNAKAWSMITSINPLDASQCTAEIHFLKKPTDPLMLPMKPQGTTLFLEDRAVIEVYTTQYYNDEAIKYVKDQSGKARPVPYEYEDVPIQLLGKVTRHELGHVFGLQHQQSDSIMITGAILATITDNDCKGVFAKYGKDWNQATVYLIEDTEKLTLDQHSTVS